MALEVRLPVTVTVFRVSMGHFRDFLGGTITGKRLHFVPIY